MAKVHFKHCALVGPQGPMAVFLVRKGRPKQVGRFMLHGRFAREALGFNVVLVFQACNVVHVSRRLTANPISMLCFSMACTAPTAHQASPVDRGRPRQTKAQDFSHGCTDGPTLSTLVARPGAPSSFLLLVAMPAPSSALIDRQLYVTLDQPMSLRSAPQTKQRLCYRGLSDASRFTWSWVDPVKMP